MEIIESDLVVIGGGMSGGFAAIKSKEAGVNKVLLATKGKLGSDSITTFAAGVLDVVFPEDDKEQEFKKRSLSDAWGAGLTEEGWLKARLDEGYERLLDLERWGCAFERSQKGTMERFPMKRGAKKVMFHGSELADVLAKQVRKNGVKVVENTVLTELLTEGGKPRNAVIGAVGFDVRTGQYKVFKAKAVVLATGGCGYRARFAAHRMDTGEGPAAAYRAGATLGRFDQLAFHTTASDFDVQGLNMFQGLGGIWLNSEGEQFMPYYDPELGNQTGMTRLSQASAMEVRAGKGPIYLDMTHFSPDNVRLLKAVLPTATRLLERAGVIAGDRIVKKIQWAPAFYGTIVSGGGVEANLKCETSLPGLYVCGDCMARARNFRSLVGAAVSGARAGRFSAEYLSKVGSPKANEDQLNNLRAITFAPLERGDGITPDHLLIRLQEILLPYDVTIIQHEARLNGALKEVQEITENELPMLYASDWHHLRLANEVRNMVLLAEIQLKSLLFRKESRDAVLREDYPYTDNVNWLKWIKAAQDNGNMTMWADAIDFQTLRPNRETFLHPIFEGANRRGIKWG
jgi:succinate dehydrogenase/fumarate reductase flavoprotein subunit